jgi:hypothetical protein
MMNNPPFGEGHLSDLKVALLTDDMLLGQEISTSFRTWKVFPFFYQTLKDLWPMLKTETVDLLVVDIRKLEDKGMLLKDHPAISHGQIPITIIMEAKYKPLLGMAQQIPHMGFIYRELNQTTQLKGAALLAASLMSMRKRLINMEQDVQKAKEEALLAHKRNDDLTKNLGKMIRIAEIVKKTHRHSLNQVKGFRDVVASFFDSWKIVQQFTICCLNDSQQKIYTPEHKSTKYQSFAPLWLGSPAVQGIDRLAREALLPCAYNYYGTDVVALDVVGDLEHPEIIIFLKVEQEKIRCVEDTYHWILLEQILSNLYKKAIVGEQKAMVGKQQLLAPWEALDLMDKLSNLETDTGERCCLILLKKFNLAVTDPSVDFFEWKNFFTDFTMGLMSITDQQIKLASFGTLDILLFLPSHAVDTLSLKIQQFVKEFDYWTYAKPQNLLWRRDQLPEVVFNAASSNHYLRRQYLSEKETLTSIVPMPPFNHHAN